MSCNNWEQGTVKIPSKEWKRVRETIIKAWNDWHQRMFDRANQLHAKLTQMKKGKRKFDLKEALRELFAGDFSRDIHSHNADVHHEHWYIESLLLVYPRSERGWILTDKLPKLQKPKKKDAKILPLSKSATLNMGEHSIVLDNKEKTVSYEARENNRSVEHGREMKIVQVMFKTLHSVEYTSRTGGSFYGNDEYNIDSGRYGAGGGSSYTTETFEKKKPQTRQSYNPYLRRW